MPVPRITKEDLKARLDGQDASALPTILDVRLKTRTNTARFDSPVPSG